MQTKELDPFVLYTSWLQEVDKRGRFEHFMVEPFKCLYAVNVAWVGIPIHFIVEFKTTCSESWNDIWVLELEIDISLRTLVVQTKIFALTAVTLQSK